MAGIAGAFFFVFTFFFFLFLYFRVGVWGLGLFGQRRFAAYTNTIHESSALIDLSGSVG